MSRATGDDGDGTDDFNAAMEANASRRDFASNVHPLRGQTDLFRASDPPALWIESQAWDEAAIPRRPWLAEGYLLRRSVTVAAGMGSAGKSSLMCAWSIALCLGMPFGRFKPVVAANVVIYNTEDDAAEQQRRLSAALRQFGRTSQDIAGKITRCGPTSIGTLLERDPVTGLLMFTRAWQALDALLLERKPGLLILDPLVELHNLDENDNTALRQAFARLRDLAVKHGCAILVVHHARKGGEAGDVDMIRGAGAIVGAARIAITIAPMSEENAAELGIGKAVRRGYFRVDTVKANYSTCADADWHQLLPYVLDNEEEVVAATPWIPSGGDGQRSRGVDPEVIAQVSAQAARGTGGGPYSPRLSADQPRSIALPMIQNGVTRLQDQKVLLNALFLSGWKVEEFRDNHRNARNGLRSPEGLPECAWSAP